MVLLDWYVCLENTDVHIHAFENDPRAGAAGGGLRSDAGARQDVLHQVLVDPGVSLQPLASDAHHLRTLQQTHLQLKRHGNLPKVPLGAALQSVPEAGRDGQSALLMIQEICQGEHSRNDSFESKSECVCVCVCVSGE